MKLKRFFTVMFLTIAIFSGLFYPFYAKATGDSNHVTQYCICCLNGLLVGNANDCPSGIGTCTVHTCLPGETKQADGPCEW